MLVSERLRNAFGNAEGKTVKERFDRKEGILAILTNTYIYYILFLISTYKAPKEEKIILRGAYLT